MSAGGDLLGSSDSLFGLNGLVIIILQIVVDLNEDLLITKADVFGSIITRVGVTNVSFLLGKNEVVVVAIISPGKRVPPAGELLTVSSILLSYNNLVVGLTIISINHPKYGSIILWNIVLKLNKALGIQVSHIWLWSGGIVLNSELWWNVFGFLGKVGLVARNKLSLS